jgi:hypothetical protein
VIARVIVLLLGWTSIAQAQTHTQATPRFDRASDWALVCDYQRQCTITGVADAPGAVRIAISITRDNTPAAPIIVRMILLRHDGVVVEDAHLHGAGHDYTLEGPGGGLILRADGTVIEGLQFFDPAQSRAIVDWFVAHRPTRLLDDGRPYAVLPRGRLVHLLRLMDRRQPEVALPEPEPPDYYEPTRFDYEIFPREQVPLDALPPEVVRECPGATPANSPAYGLDHNTNPTLMLVVPCGDQSQIFTWFPGSPPSRQILRDAIGQRYTHMTATYDDNQGLLHLRFTNGRRQDCGYGADWAWVDGEGFMRLQSWWMPDCRGLPPILWPRTFLLPSWAIR